MSPAFGYNILGHGLLVKRFFVLPDAWKRALSLQVSGQKRPLMPTWSATLAG